MTAVKDLYIELDQLGDSYEIPGKDGQSYRLHTFMSYVDHDTSRGFLELSTTAKDYTNRAYIMEIGGSDISIAIREGGSLMKDRLAALKENYLDGMRERGIDPDRLHDITPKSPDEEVRFEDAARLLLEQSPIATSVARNHHLKTGLADRPQTFDV